ncbi:MAG TPA: FAD-binding oxidoreductase [Candidatus Limnocylindrales bacterium]|jgi:glycine/D-amino acid oxidase-like deaminating enzyme
MTIGYEHRPPWDDAGIGGAPIADLPARADVVVIGGGIMGAATAYELSVKGASVVLLEKGRVGGEQSGRNWGWVRQQARDEDELPLMQASNARWRALEAELGASIEWTQAGNLALATDPARIAFFESWVKLAEAAGLDTRIIDQAEIRRLLPALEGEWLGAMYTPSDAHAEPLLATRAFASAAEARGVVIAEDCAVDRILVAGGRVTGVATERGAIRAEHVVCAAGVWAARLLGGVGVDLPVRIVHTSVARTRPVERITEMGVGYHPVVSLRQRHSGALYLAAGGWSDYDITLDSFSHLRAFLPNYLKNRKMIKVHVGRPLLEDLRRRALRRDLPWQLRHDRVLSPPANPEKVRSAVANFRRIFPTIPIEIDRAWAGYTDTTPDAIPVIDELSSPAGLVVATGFSGHGFGMGPIVGRLVAEQIADRQPSLDLHAFRHGRFADGTYHKARLVA